MTAGVSIRPRAATCRLHPIRGQRTGTWRKTTNWSLFSKACDQDLHLAQEDKVIISFVFNGVINNITQQLPLGWNPIGWNWSPISRTISWTPVYAASSLVWCKWSEGNVSCCHSIGTCYSSFLPTREEMTRMSRPTAIEPKITCSQKLHNDTSAMIGFESRWFVLQTELFSSGSNTPNLTNQRTTEKADIIWSQPNKTIKLAYLTTVSGWICNIVRNGYQSLDDEQISKRS